MATKDLMPITAETKDLLEEALAIPAETEYVETGNIGFDMAISNGMGLPLGYSILLWAEPGVGKTTLFADVSKRLITKYKAIGEPFKVLYLGVEGSRELLYKLGLKPYVESHDFIYLEKRLCWRQIEKFYDAILSGYGDFKDVKLVVIDSVNNVLSDQNLKNSIADGDFGTRSKERGNFYGKYLPMCKTAGVSSLLVAQARQNQDAGMFEAKTKAAASWGDRHNVDIIIKCSRKTDDKDASKIEEETCFGKAKEVEKYIMTLDPNAANCKNRIDRVHKTEILIEQGVGAHNYYVVRKILELNKYIKGSGWYTFDQVLVDELGLPEGKLRLPAVNNAIKENTGAIVEFLKREGCYSIVRPGSLVEIPADVEEE